jgi:predicted Fe-S protein YdhL (DUF1289 family)
MMPDDAVTNTAFELNPASPCLGICLMDPRTRMCRGCFRTIDEIAGWYRANSAEKHRILERLAVRRASAATLP